MSVHNEFMIEIYGFMHSLCTLLVHAAHGAIAISRNRIQRKEDPGRLENESRDIEDS